jgi:hypothetical protein
MTPPQGSSPRPPRPRAASPAERSAEFLETQRRLKEEAAERRRRAAEPKGTQARHPPTSG